MMDEGEMHSSESAHGKDKHIKVSSRKITKDIIEEEEKKAQNRFAKDTESSHDEL